MVDIHIPSVLVFPPKTEFFTHEAYKSTKIVLQDKVNKIDLFNYTSCIFFVLG